MRVFLFFIQVLTQNLPALIATGRLVLRADVSGGLEQRAVPVVVNCMYFEEGGVVL